MKLTQDINLIQALEDREGISHISIHTYKARLHRLTQATGNNIKNSIMQHKQSYDILKNKYKSTTTRKSIVTAILAIIAQNKQIFNKDIIDKWKTTHRILAQIETNRRDDNRATKDMKDKMPNIVETRQTAAALKKKGLHNKQDSMDHLLIKMMVDMPPKRADFGMLKVYDKEPGQKEATIGNFVVVPKEREEPVTLVMNEYKTAKRKGTFTEQIPKDIATDLRKSLKDFPRQFVFVGRDGGPMKENAYSEYVKRAFLKHTGKHAGINALRHAYITQECNPAKKTTAELKKIAESMNHSILMQTTYHIVGGGRTPE